MHAGQPFARTDRLTVEEFERDQLPVMFAPGELIAGTYLVRGVLGSGGMGQVYAADDVELQRPVAIKTNGTRGSAELRLEAQALAQVHHRNVVSVHRFGVHRDLPFLVMERLYGRTLAEHVTVHEQRGRPMELDLALELLAAIADGLAALHEAGVAHLDLKPGNVMVTAGRPVVLFDLGI